MNGNNGHIKEEKGILVVGGVI